MVHRLRRHCQAVLIGKTTVVADNPSLLIRRVEAPRQPLRVVLDPRLELLVDLSKYQLFQDGYETIVFHGDHVEAPMTKLPSSVHCVPTPWDSHGQLSLPFILQSLEQEFDVEHVMVEGGPATARAFLTQRLVDRCLVVQAPLTFVEPLPAGLNDAFLQQQGLVYLGSRPSGVDTIAYWSRPVLAWPSGDALEEWP